MAITEQEVCERVFCSIHVDGTITELVAGLEYTMQAIEERDGGLWLYSHTVAVTNFPYPYTAEMFEFLDTTLSMGWGVVLQFQGGSVICKILTFHAWATDDHFFERLLDGDVETTTAYRRLMANS